MQGYKNRSALRVRGCGTIVKRRVFISLSRLHDLKPLQLERAANLNRKIKNDLTLADTAGASRARVRPSMSRIKHNDIEPVWLSLRPKLGGHRSGHRSLRGIHNWSCLRRRRASYRLLGF